MKMHKQSGFVMFSSLIFLVLMIYIGLAMFRGFGLDQVISGNLREKSRATEAAQAAIQYAEWWLLQSTDVNTGGKACAAGALTKPTICSGTPGLTAYATYTNSTAFPISTTGGAGTYYASPIYSIYYAGISKPTCSKYFIITAQGTGGNKSAVTTIQTVYFVTRIGPGDQGGNGASACS